MEKVLEERKVVLSERYGLGVNEMISAVENTRCAHWRAKP